MYDIVSRLEYTQTIKERRVEIPLWSDMEAGDVQAKILAFEACRKREPKSRFWDLPCRSFNISTPGNSGPVLSFGAPGNGMYTTSS